MNLPVFDRTVTCVPEIVERKRTKEDRFILMGCDGLWNI